MVAILKYRNRSIMALADFSGWLWMMWGRWFHLTLAVGMVSLELLALAAERGRSPIQ